MNGQSNFEQLQKYAELYVQHKDKLFPIIEKYSGNNLPKDATHGEVATVYIELLKTDFRFRDEVSNLLNKYYNASGPFGELVSGVVGIFSKKQDQKLLEQQAKNQSDAALYQMILQKQGGNNTTTILIVSVIALLAVGGTIYLIIKYKK